MKRLLTFPLQRVILKSLTVFVLFVVVGWTVILLYPKSFTQLTLVDKNKQHYQTLCPMLSKPLLTSEVASLPASFTLLNWNIYKQQKPGWENALQEWSTNADIITLQEAKLSPELIAFSQQNLFWYLQNNAFKHNDFLYGVNTLSKVKHISTCGSTALEPWIRVQKSALATTYPIQGAKEPLLVINLHGINFTFNTQLLQQQLSPYLALIAKHTGPTIFSGDFNTWSKERKTMVENALKTLGFSEVQFELDERLTVLGLPLDHIYFRGLTVLKAQSLATTTSDHTPQLVRFDLKKQK